MFTAPVSLDQKSIRKGKNPFPKPETEYFARVLTQNAQTYPNHTALRFKQFGLWQDITWKSYLESAQKIAAGLYALGVRPGDKVAIQSENRPEWLFADCGSAILRAAIVGLYPTNPIAEIRYLLKDSEAKVVIAEDQEQVDKAIAVFDECPNLEWIVYLDARGLHSYEHPQLISIDELIEKAEGGYQNYLDIFSEIDQQRTEEDIATLIYTSGTTGPPKGVMLTARNISFAGHVFSVEGGVFGYGLGPNDSMLSYLPLSHVVERALSVWGNLLVRTVVHFAESIETVTQDLAEVQPSRLFAVPRIWEKIQATVSIKIASASALKRFFFRFGERLSKTIAAERIANDGKFNLKAKTLYGIGYPIIFRPLRKRLGLLHVKHSLSGAAPIAPDTLKFFLGIGLPLYEAYGMTENSAVATTNFTNAMKIGTVGQTQLWSETKLDEITGEVLTRNDGTFVGYWKKPEATAETITADGWLRTGDVGEWVGEDHLRIVDRIKDIIITAGGKNISPSEIENKLKSSPFIKEAVVIGDKRAYLSALIGIEFDTVADWASRQHIEYTTYRDLASKPEVINLVKGLVKETNKEFARVEAIRKFRMLTKELDHEDGELTATQKLKRKAFEATVPGLVDDMYSNTTAYPGADLGREG